MQVLNAGKSSLVFKLDNGEYMNIAPGAISEPFIGSKVTLTKVLNAGNSKSIGIIVTNNYELGLIRELPTSFNYLYNSEAEAREKLLSGKSEEEVKVESVSKDSIEVLKLKNQIDSLHKTVEEKDAEIAKLSKNNDKDEIRKLNDIVTDKNKQLLSYEDRIKELSTEVETLKAESIDTAKRIKSLTEDVDAKDQEILNLNEKISEYESPMEADVEEVAKDSELIKNLNEKIEEQKKLIDELDAEAHNSQSVEFTDEQKEALENYAKLKEENANLKKDGAALYEKYEKARSSALDICKKFNITYVDGEWVQTAGEAPKK